MHARSRSIAVAICREVEGHGCLRDDGTIGTRGTWPVGALSLVLAQTAIAGAIVWCGVAHFSE